MRDECQLNAWSLEHDGPGTRTGIDRVGRLLGDGEAEVLVHGKGLEAGNLGVEGVDGGRGDDDVGHGIGPGGALPGGQAQVGDDVVDLFDLVADGDAVDLVAIVRHLLVLGPGHGGRGQPEQGGDGDEILHAGWRVNGGTGGTGGGRASRRRRPSGRRGNPGFL